MSPSVSKACSVQPGSRSDVQGLAYLQQIVEVGRGRHSPRVDIAVFVPEVATNVLVSSQLVLTDTASSVGWKMVFSRSMSIQLDLDLETRVADRAEIHDSYFVVSLPPGVSVLGLVLGRLGRFSSCSNR